MSQDRIAGPGPCVRSPFPIPGPFFPQMPPVDDEAGQTGYVFPTWRDALADAQGRISGAYAYRERLFRKASEAGLSYREIGEAAGISATMVGKVLGKQKRVTLDDQANA